MKRSKRFLSLLLAVIMVGTLMPSGVFAATGNVSESNVIYAEGFEELTTLTTTTSIPVGALVFEPYWGGRCL